MNSEKKKKSNFQIKLSNHLKKIHTSPYLFIGSGLSNRYINTGSWKNLLTEVCQDIKMPNNFNYYFSRADQDLPKVASVISEDFFDMWWKNDDFLESRNLFSADAKSKSSPLKYEISNHITKKGTTPLESYSIEYNLFRKINIDGIITTNWDTLLENTFPEFKTFIGQDNLIFNNSIDLGEIYKIHGCISNPNSLILTDEDYSDFNSKNPYLAAKLLTIFMEHPIIFLGYNIGDPNIHQILKSIIHCFNRDNIDRLKDRLIFCERKSDINESTISDSTILIGEITIPIKRIQYNSLEDLFTVLSNNKRKLPLKILKNMKNMVYDYVKNTKSKSKIFLNEVDLDKLDSDKVEFFYGIGLKEQLSMVGVKGLGMQDLLEDCISANINIEPLSIVKNVLPTIQGKYIPYFKYLRNSNLLNENGEIPTNDETIELSPNFISKINNIKIKNFYPSGSYLNKKEEINKKYDSFKKLISVEDTTHAIIYTSLLDPNKIPLDELFAFIIQNFQKNIKNTNMRKLICMYDFLKYKEQLNKS